MCPKLELNKNLAKVCICIIFVVQVVCLLLLWVALALTAFRRSLISIAFSVGLPTSDDFPSFCFVVVFFFYGRIHTMDTFNEPLLLNDQFYANQLIKNMDA